MKILIVDDDLEILALFLHYFKSTPYTICTAVNGSIAVEQFKVNSFDIIFMDIDMPILNGYEAILEMRRWEVLQGIDPALMFIVSARESHVENGKDLAANSDGYFKKPLNKITLLQLLSEVKKKKAA